MIIVSLVSEIESSLEASKSIYPGLLFDIKNDLSNAYSNFNQIITKQKLLKPDYLLVKAYLAKQLNRYQESIDTCHLILNIDQINLGALILISMSYMQTSRLKEGNYFYSKAVNIRDDDEDLWHLYGFCLLKGYREEDSIKAFKKSISLGSQDSEVYHWLGNAYLRTGKKELAIRALIKGYNAYHEKTTRTLHYLFDSIKGLLEPSSKANYYDSLSQRSLDIIDKENISIFGDSHIAIFRDILNVDVTQLGHPTAFNLISGDATSEGIQQIRSKLKNTDPKKTAIVLNFGEIDVRVHIYKQATIQKRSLKESIEIVVNRYMLVIDEIIQKGFLTIVCGPFGTGCGIPSYGENSDRNILCRLLNNEIEIQMKKRNMPFFTVNNLIIDHQKMNTDVNFFGEIDENHLNIDVTTKTLYMSELYNGLLKWSKSNSNIDLVSRYERREHCKNVLYFSRVSDSNMDWGRVTKEGNVKSRMCELFILDLGSGYIVDSIRIKLITKSKYNISSQLKISFHSGDIKEAGVSECHEEILEINSNSDIDQEINLGKEAWVRFISFSSKNNIKFQIFNISASGNYLRCVKNISKEFNL